MKNFSIKSCGKAHAYCSICKPGVNTHPPGSKKRRPKPCDLELRFWSKVDFDGPLHENPNLGKCWEWKASTAKGYGQVKVGNKQLKSHRLSWMLLVGEIPKGLVLDHSCRNKICCNIQHLTPVTNAENQRRIRPSKAPPARKSREYRQLGQIYSLYRYLRAVEETKQVA